ncbi:MAG: hypothetical protein QGI33_05270 [Candidatus Brocadiia bacterium]|nr:hypothetical protein [Candidatus Brocadiia bacterium]
MATILTTVIVVEAAVGVLVGLRLMFRKIGCDCPECARRVCFFDELTDEEKGQILHYFRTREGREPETGAIFACRRCGLVMDDFSGENLSMDGDCRSFCKVCGSPRIVYMAVPIYRGVVARFQRANPHLIPMTECLRCERNPQANLDCIDCDTENPVMARNDCKTLYMWKPMDGCGEFRFFVPLTDGIVRQIPPTHIAH